MCTAALNVSCTATNNYVEKVCITVMKISIYFHGASRSLEPTDVEYVQKQDCFSNTSNVAQYTFDFHQKPHRCRPPPRLPLFLTFWHCLAEH